LFHNAEHASGHVARVLTTREDAHVCLRVRADVQVTRKAREQAPKRGVLASTVPGHEDVSKEDDFKIG
jgi:hypothetical protein